MKTFKSEAKYNKDQVSKKHLIYFFGLFESTKYNSEHNEFKKLVDDQNIDIHLFDYPHFAEIVRPKNSKIPKQFIFLVINIIITACTITALYLNNKMTQTNIIFISSISLITSFLILIIPIIANSIFTKIISENYADKLEKGMNEKEVKYIKKQLTGIEESDKSKKEDIKDIINFLCDKNTINAIKFTINGKTPVMAGVKLVIDLLEKGIEPNDIIIMGNSIGGAIATEVLNHFENEGIYLTLINHNSFTELNSTIRSLPSPFGKFFSRHPKLLSFWLNYFKINLNPQNIIKSTKAPILVSNVIGDNVISKEVQMAENLLENFGCSNEKLTNGNSLKAAALLKHNSTQCNINDQNLHMDAASHMIIKKHKIQEPIDTEKKHLLENINSFIEEDQNYTQFLTNFISLAQEYLEKSQLNKGYDINTFKKSKLYKKSTKNKIIIDENVTQNITKPTIVKQKHNAIST